MNSEEEHLAWIALGSNIDPAANLPRAVQQLSRLGTVIGCSSVWQSPAVGDVNQADFCNAAVLLQTRLAIPVLKRKLREIEAELGRVRDPQNKNAPRTLDLDIALYDAFVGEVAGAIIPDPEILQRPFLAVPLAEVSPETPHPVTGESLQTLADRCRHGAILTKRMDVVLPIPG